MVLPQYKIKYLGRKAYLFFGLNDGKESPGEIRGFFCFLWKTLWKTKDQKISKFFKKLLKKVLTKHGIRAII